jgi:hypothetical protein
MGECVCIQEGRAERKYQVALLTQSNKSVLRGVWAAAVCVW